MSEEVNFNNIMVPRRTRCGIFKFMTRKWVPQKTMMMDKYYSPSDLKEDVANSVYLDSVIEAESVTTGVPRERLKQEVQQYLEEMSLDRKMYVIRWMGIVFLKISSMMNIGVFVNESAVFKMKATMGKNPVLFLPTHRSYADFCLMTYLCYHYDIDLPAVAAGMDFYSMAVVGRCMRETCAFYIRRTLAGAPLYAATLRHYVRALVARHGAPIEFFLEGTRSRSNKSLPPKYGMLSMSLVPLFAREVPDITIVPVNISYDRLMEHSLFAYEHLGVPKPKESTGGLLKALRGLNDHFGNVYINVGKPLSVKEYLNNDTFDRDETLKPLDLQQLTADQFKKVQDVANYVITLQQKNTVVTISNLLALVVMQSLMKNEPLVLEQVVEEVGWMVGVLRGLGASVFEDDVEGSVQRILTVHSKMLKLDREKRLRLLSSSLMDITSEIKKKMKGYTLKAETMVNAIPVIQLQLYVNPVLHYLVPPAIVCLIVQRHTATQEQLAEYYFRIRKLLGHEFFYLERNEEPTFQKAVEYCLQNNVIATGDGRLIMGGESKLQHLLEWAIWPALTTLLMCCDVMLEHVECDHKQALKLVQERVEAQASHPYCLSLEATANCLQGLVLAGALLKTRGQQEVTYRLVPNVMKECHCLITSVLPTFNVDFGKNNSVILDHRVLSRL